MKGFVYRLLPPRPTFALDMSPAERETMMEHAAYWAKVMQEGKVVAFGPVADPAEPYGLGIVLAEELAEVESLRDADPAIRAPYGLRAEISPMFRLVTPGATYDAG